MKREFVDRLGDPSPLELALEHCLDVLSQIPITVVAVGITANGVEKQDLVGDKLTFVTYKSSLTPFPDSEPIKKLLNMELKDEAVHYLLKGVEIHDDKIVFSIDDVPVEVTLINKGQYPSCDDPDVVNYRYDYVYVPNATYEKRGGQKL